MAYILLGNANPGLGSISAIEVVIFVLVIGEEIGWRGFLMPRLRARMGLATAGLLTGVIWTLWHLPIYLAPDQGLAAFAVFAWWVVPLAVVMGFVAERASYSVLVATVMHGAANIATPILLPGVDHTWTMLATGTVYLLLAVTLVVRSTGLRPDGGPPAAGRRRLSGDDRMTERRPPRRRRDPGKPEAPTGNRSGLRDLLRGIRDLRVEPAHVHRVGDALHGQQVGRGPHVALLALGDRRGSRRTP